MDVRGSSPVERELLVSPPHPTLFTREHRLPRSGPVDCSRCICLPGIVGRAQWRRVGPGLAVWVLLQANWSWKRLKDWTETQELDWQISDGVDKELERPGAGWLSLMWLSSLMADKVNASIESNSSFRTSLSFTCSLSPHKNTPWSTFSFHPDLAARMWKATEYSATLRGP